MNLKEVQQRIFENIRHLEKTVESAQIALKKSKRVQPQQQMRFEQIVAILQTLKDKSIILSQAVESEDMDLVLESANLVCQLSLMIRDESITLLEEMVKGISKTKDEIIH